MLSLSKTRAVCLAFLCGLALAATASALTPPKGKKQMQLGNFSVSLAVKDLAKSRAFYEKLDFKQVGGKSEQNWIILQNGDVTVGLFQGMFEKNIMTFNPGWDKDQKTPKGFTDVRDLQKMLKKRGITPVTAADEDSTGPAHFILADPDGNTIFFDQHVDKPKK